MNTDKTPAVTEAGEYELEAFSAAMTCNMIIE